MKSITKWFRLLLPKHVTSKLKCDLCRAYLSVPPISTYEEKFSCGRCNPGWPRNTVYEELAQFMYFPCTYCEETLAWAQVEQHESTCRQHVVLCPSRYERNLKISKLPGANYGEYHRACQYRSIVCPFDCCDSLIEIKSICEHFGKFHKDYVFADVVEARKILKEEKVWNFNSDTQVCLLIYKLMPFLLFVHSLCSYDESTGDIRSYEYFFGVFSLCQEPCDIQYAVKISLSSETENSMHTMNNQEIKPFNEKLQCINYLRIGLCQYKSFNFMTTHFEKLKHSKDLKLSYRVKFFDGFQTAVGKYENERAFVNLENLAKSFECPICKEYMCAPVYNCNVGHTVCKRCRDKMVICPFCQAVIGNSRNFVLEDILETLQISCQNDTRGCGFMGTVKDIKLHELMCIYNTIK